VRVGCGAGRIGGVQVSLPPQIRSRLSGMRLALRGLALRWFALLRCSLSAALMLAGGLMLPAAGGAQPVEMLEPTQAAPGIWYFRGAAGMADAANRGFMSNAGFVVTGDGVVVFDALGTPRLGEAMVAAIRRVTPQPIRRVIVSHYHADHFYGLPAFKRAGAEIWAHAAGRQYLASDLAGERLAQRRRDLAPWFGDGDPLIGADRWLDFAGGGTLAFELGGRRFRVIDVGGAHSPEDLMLWVDDARVLFAGDLYFSGRLPFVGSADVAAWLATLERIAPLAPAVVIPGHGAASSDPARDIATTRRYLQYLMKTMGEAVDAMATFDEAYAQTDWRPFAGEPAFEQANRANAYNVFLQMEARALGRPAPRGQ
jgi:glyoxylase-like metal-dependent hydrolase (beta-lactamase superfamily II)